MYTYAFKAVVGQQVYVQASGQYIRYQSVAKATSNPKLRIKTDQQDEFDLLPGQGVTLPKRAGQFRLTNVDGIADISGTLLIGEGSMMDNRVSGEVSIIDGSYFRSLGVQAFTTFQTVAAVAGQLGHLQLWNPAGSNRLLVVHTIRAALDAAGTAQLHIRQFSSALATLIGSASPKYINATPGGVLGEVRVTTNAAPFGNGLVYSSVTQAGVVLTLQDPIIVPQGWGVMAVCNLANTAMSGSFEHYYLNL